MHVKKTFNHPIPLFLPSTCQDRSGGKQILERLLQKPIPFHEAIGENKKDFCRNIPPHSTRLIAILISR